MENRGMAKLIARWSVLGALFLLPIAPLIVANGYFFPFITGKAFYLRILIEVAVAGWVVLAFLDKEYRPRFSGIGAAVVGFVAWMFVADALAVNSLKAFWSNFERMEGWVLLIHLLGFFFAASAVLRVEQKWRAWFLTSLGVSVIISGYALMQLAGYAAIHQGSTRVDASLGNSAYLAIYFLFSVFIASWLALTEKRGWLKWSLIALAVLEGVLLFYTETRGAVIGLVLGLSLACTLIIFTAGKRARSYATGGLILIILAAGSLYLARDSSFVQSSHTLQRITSISLEDGETRFRIWGMAWKGVLERPIFGWGQEGFNYVFNTYYDPGLYAQEPWFDRAHNAFIDWLTAGGIPAFLLYLSLFGSALTLLWSRTELSRPERIALTAALAGYAVHNFFVFDNLYSYIYFFALLALIDSQVARPIERLERLPELSPAQGATFALPVAAVMLFAVVWLVNVTGMQTSGKLIAALSSGDAAHALNTFKDITARPTFAMQEVREQIVSFAGAVVQSPVMPIEQKQQAVSLAISEMQKQVEAYPYDARGYLQLSYAYRLAGDGANALRAVQIASELSPTKQQILIEKGQLELELGNIASAQEAFTKAYALDPRFKNELAVYAAAGYIAAGDQDAGDKLLIEEYGTTRLDHSVLSMAYFRAKNWPRLIAFWKDRTAVPGASLNTWFSLAAAYYAAGDKAGAVQAVRSAIVVYPEAAAAGKAAIEEIQGKTSSQ